MNTEVQTTPETPPAAEEKERSKRDYRKYGSILLFVLAFACIVGGLQAMAFYGRFAPGVSEVNDEMFVLMSEKTRGVQIALVQQRFQDLRARLKGHADVLGRVDDLYEIMGEHFREGPLGTVEQVLAGIPSIRDQLKQKNEATPAEALTLAGEDLDRLAEDLERLRGIYFVPYEQLHADLEDLPFYLWPGGGIARDNSGYLATVTFNRAIYLSQIGEIGTARVLLSGMYSQADDREFMGLVYYGLGRLQWELFLSSAEPENYFQAANYLRQSMQTDPGASLPKRLFDYMLSLTEAEPTPGAGKGDPTTLTEGEAGAVSESPPLF